MPLAGKMMAIQHMNVFIQLDYIYIYIIYTILFYYLLFIIYFIYYIIRGSVSASGVYTQTPKTAPPGSQWQFKLSQPLGKSKLDSIQIGKELDKLKKHFAADKYELLTFNCNHFTEAFAQALGVHQNYPSWVNRAAHYGSKLRYVCRLCVAISSHSYQSRCM